MTLNNFAILLSLALVLVAGPVFIPYLKRLKFGQTIREEGPSRHFEKQGTPTMGGILFIFAITAGFLVAGLQKTPWVYALAGLWLFGFIGFLDDFIKVVLRRNLGLRAYQKMGLQILFAVLIGYLTRDAGQSLLLPMTAARWELGWLYIPFVVVFMTAVTNSVNLTDGLDGLATLLSMIVMIFFAVLGIRAGDASLVDGALIVIAALTGFLYFNRYPAKVFMGDTGSLALGGVIGGFALISGTPIFMILVGGVFVIETISVILQVTSFKLTGKRVFKMAPLHHHFELKNWSERRIVRIFSLAGALCLALGLIMWRG